MKKFNILLVTALMLLSASCDEKFLDRSPIDFMSPDNIRTEKDVAECVNGIYKAYISDTSEPIKTDFMADNGYYVGYQAMWQGVYTNETTIVEDKWKRNYKTILRANTVLAKADGIDMDENKKKQYIGEARFLRALAYFDLGVFYGNVPLRIHPDGLSEKDIPLTPAAQVFDFVCSELEEAASLLPVSYGDSDRGRATKGAAWSIMARCYLFNKDYPNAEKYCKKVRELGVYRLMPDYSHLFLPDYELENTETIFDMEFVKNAIEQGASNSWYTYFSVWAGYQILKNLEEQYYTLNGKSILDPDNEMYNTTVNKSVFNVANVEKGVYDNRFTNRDPRMYVTIVVPYSFNGWHRTTGKFTTYVPYDRRQANFTSFRARKYVDYSDDYINNISGVNPIIIRYADILLMEAEALVEQGVYDESHVMSLVDSVRQRASVKMPKIEDAEGTGLSVGELRKIIRHERRVEFALEGLRYIDIMRWEIGDEGFSSARGYKPDLLKGNSAVYEEYTYMKRTFDRSKGYKWPIPKSESDSNNAIKQK